MFAGEWSPGMLWRNVMCRKWCRKLFQVMQPGINQSACGEETTRSTLDWDSQAAAMLGWKFWVLLFWKATLENVLLIKKKKSAQWRERHAWMSHVRKRQGVETETQLCNYFVYLANLGREIQLLPWKVGKSSVEKSTLTQCCSGLWRKLHRCRFHSEGTAK